VRFVFGKKKSLHNFQAFERRGWDHGILPVYKGVYQVLTYIFFINDWQQFVIFRLQYSPQIPEFDFRVLKRDQQWVTNDEVSSTRSGAKYMAIYK